MRVIAVLLFILFILMISIGCGPFYTLHAHTGVLSEFIIAGAYPWAGGGTKVAIKFEDGKVLSGWTTDDNLLFYKPTENRTVYWLERDGKITSLHSVIPIGLSFKYGDDVATITK